MTKRYNIIVILIAVIISAGIWIITFNKQTAKNKIPLAAKIFKGSCGWGYDILVNDTVFIHQEFIPSLAGKKGFPKKEQAEEIAQLIINKMKSGRPPAVTTFDLEQTFRLNETQYGQPEKSQ